MGHDNKYTDILNNNLEYNSVNSATNSIPHEVYLHWFFKWQSYAAPHRCVAVAYFCAGESFTDARMLTELLFPLTLFFKCSRQQWFTVLGLLPQNTLNLWVNPIQYVFAITLFHSILCLGKKCYYTIITSIAPVFEV